MSLKVTKHGEPDLCPEGVPLLQGAVVGQGVVVEEHAGRDVEGDEHVDGVVLVGGQDEEDAKHVQHPGEDVQVVHSSGSIFCDEEVEECEGGGVAAEHVVSTRPHAHQAEAAAAPDQVSLTHFGPSVTLDPWGTFQVGSRD